MHLYCYEVKQPNLKLKTAQHKYQTRMKVTNYENTLDYYNMKLNTVKTGLVIQAVAFTMKQYLCVNIIN